MEKSTILALLAIFSIFSGFLWWSWQPALDPSPLVNMPKITENSTSKWYKNREFGIVIDAGSSGSRLQVYSWKNTEHVRSLLERNQGRWRNLTMDSLPIIDLGDEAGKEWQFRVEPGISTFGQTPSQLGGYLKPLLDHALKLVPADKVSSTPIFLYATAGMRLLPPDQQAGILTTTCSFIKESTKFLLPDCRKHVQVISGEWEGIYGWVAINHLMNGFNPKGNTLGFLDMGGASTQIAFEPDKELLKEHAEDMLKVKLRSMSGADREFHVYVTTFLGYGMNEARRRYVDWLIGQALKENPWIESGKDGEKDQSKEKPSAEDDVKASKGKSKSKPVKPVDDDDDEDDTPKTKPSKPSKLEDDDDVKPVKSKSKPSKPLEDSKPVKQKPSDDDDDEEDAKPVKTKLSKPSKPSKPSDDEDASPTLSTKATPAKKKPDSRDRVKEPTDLTVPDFSTLADNASWIKHLNTLVIDDHCLPKGAYIDEEDHLPLNLQGKGAKPMFRGTGKFLDCLITTIPLLNKNAPCPDNPCLFNGVHIPGGAPGKKTNLHFVGISEYWYTSDNVFGLGGDYAYHDYQAAARKFCGQPWNTTMEKFEKGLYPSVSALDRLELQCFKSAWIVNILHEGLGIPKELLLEEEDDIVPVRSVNEINGLQVSWTLGVILLYASGTIPPVGWISQTTLPETVVEPVQVGSRYLLPLIVLSIVGLAVFSYWLRNRNRKSYRGVEAWKDTELGAMGRSRNAINTLY